MQFKAVWILVRGSEPGSGGAKGFHEPGSRGTWKSVARGEPSCRDAGVSMGPASRQTKVTGQAS